ncbi:hypothetical protein [Providencia burhodogranariea]|uniref:hypothetical protein n=1 Tax=Providencia burhodogranariea TaxID=516074 RepID=UPI0002E502C0|nr:hypothetical protein [Providencia burhodogranariea]
MKSKWFLMFIGASGVANFSAVNAEEVEFAKKLANPVAALVSVPFQFNYDKGYGSANGTRSGINIQPVIPFAINNDWNVISRTIMPVISQHDIVGKSGDQFGMSDITQSIFFLQNNPPQMDSSGELDPSF